MAKISPNMTWVLAVGLGGFGGLVLFMLARKQGWIPASVTRK